MSADAAIYAGRVIHKRLRPKPHALSYRVFSLLIDVASIDAIANRLKLLSHNRFNVFSFYDADHGPGDGTPALDVARRCLADAGRPSEGRRVLLLAYPRVFGYVFNPLSVFYVYAPDGRLETLIYEVNNTFGERTSYVVAAGEIGNAGVYAQACAKEMFVSPFAEGKGDYGFRITDPAGEALVAVLLSDAAGGLIKTHFRAKREELTDGRLAGLLIRFPLLTLKIIVAIHYEAFKLWLKGMPLTDRHTSPRYSTKPVLTQKKG
jgi:uncharacterized protein